VIAQPTIEESDGVADERLQAMGMLNDEIKLWVTRCRQLVGVLQEVEMERDNFKAGEGHAKELGTGFKVKLEQEDSGSGPPELSSIAAELANTKAQLAIVQVQADGYKARFDAADNLFDDEEMKKITRASSPSEADCPFPDTLSERSLSHTNDLHTQLFIAIQKQDKHQRELIFEQDYLRSRLSDYRQESKEYGPKLADLKLKLKTATAEQDSLLRDHTNEQETLSGEAIQSTETYKALRAEIILANRALEGSEKDHLASHRYYVYKLDQMAGYIEDEMVKSEIDSTSIEGDSPSHSPDTLLVERGLLQSDRGISRRPPRPARGTPARIRSTSLFVLEWTRDTMLSTPMVRIKEWSGKHMIYELRETESIGDEALGEDIPRFRAKVGLNHVGDPDPGEDKLKRSWARSIVDTKPSRSDGKTLPAIWARMDQLCKGATVFPTSLPNFESIRSTSHGNWLEVVLAIYSWSFYKIHDSNFDATSQSQKFLADLFRIWWESGDNFSNRFCETTDGEIYEATYARSEAIARNPLPMPSSKISDS
jgi:hypothetical protein